MENLIHNPYNVTTGDYSPVSNMPFFSPHLLLNTIFSDKKNVVAFPNSAQYSSTKFVD